MKCKLGIDGSGRGAVVSQIRKIEMSLNALPFHDHEVSLIHHTTLMSIALAV